VSDTGPVGARSAASISRDVRRGSLSLAALGEAVVSAIESRFSKASARRAMRP
jgi:hypothetical protein